MISALATATRTVVERIRADWLIVLAAFTTITLAAVLLASGPIYAEAVTRSALQRSLSGGPELPAVRGVRQRRVDRHGVLLRRRRERAGMRLAGL